MGRSRAPSSAYSAMPDQSAGPTVFETGYTVLAWVCRFIAITGASLLAGGMLAVLVYGISYAIGRGFTEGKQSAWVRFDGEEVVLVDPE